MVIYMIDASTYAVGLCECIDEIILKCSLLGICSRFMWMYWWNYSVSRDSILYKELLPLPSMAFSSASSGANASVAYSGASSRANSQL